MSPDISLSHPMVERLLSVMDQKHHWAHPHFTRPGLSRAQLFEHFRHEYAVYVRDFPVLLARMLRKVPDLIDVRRALAENLHEKHTGARSKSAPHAELFLRMMEGMGYDRAAFTDADLHPAAREYKDWLFTMSADKPWQAACALLTIWLAGTANERAELAGTYRRAKGDAAVQRHPLAVHYGCPPSAMQFVRGDVEDRSEAWRILHDHVTDVATTKLVVDTCMEALVRWRRYRDGVAERMHLARDEDSTTQPPPVVYLRSA